MRSDPCGKKNYEYDTDIYLVVLVEYLESLMNAITAFLTVHYAIPRMWVRAEDCGGPVDDYRSSDSSMECTHGFQHLSASCRQFPTRVIDTVTELVV